jgi:hypothetical protein
MSARMSGPYLFIAGKIVIIRLTICRHQARLPKTGNTTPKTTAHTAELHYDVTQNHLNLIMPDSGSPTQVSKTVYALDSDN